MKALKGNRDDVSVIDRIMSIDWHQHEKEIFEQGYSIIPRVLIEAECRALIELYDNPAQFRKTVNMARHRFGVGEYQYFGYDLPEIIQNIRTHFYPPLARVTNAWNQVLHVNNVYPPSHETFLERCRVAGQLLPTPLILKYGPGGYNTLHQDLYGDVYFPLQAVCLLSDPHSEFTGGEFVLLEQVPRAQSRAIVVKPARGDAVIFTTRFRPEKGSRGYYRVQVKHGVSEVHEGSRFSMGITFHDATT